MNKNTKMFKAAILASVVVVSGCAAVAVTYETISAGEVLPSLTKITESAKSETPFGGDDDGPIFFSYDATKTGHYDIYKKDKPLSGSMSQMTDLGTTGFAWFPTYNKATDKVAFCMGYDIYTMPATKGKALTQITSTNNVRDNHPCFNPDGSLIVYDRNKSSLATDGKYYYFNKNAEIWIKNIKSGENTLLGKGMFPSFSHDGKKIVYTKYEGNKSKIWIMDADGDNQTTITDNSTLGEASHPRFSPNDKWIVFTGYDKDNNSDIYIIPVEGGDYTRLTISKSSDYLPYWSTDGYIYFTSDRGGKKGEYNIWRFKYSDKQ
jgi:TolB protein